MTRSPASFAPTIGNRRSRHRPVGENRDAGGGPSQPYLRARLALAGNRSQRYAPAGSSNVTGWCSGLPASSRGAHPAVIIHSAEIRGVGVVRAVGGRAFKQHLMHPSSKLATWLAFVYMPPMFTPGLPCARRPFGLPSGISEMSASVVSSSEAIDEAFCSALRTTLAGSMTPAFTRSS